MDIKTIYSRFSCWAAIQPDAPAVREDGRSATYRDLGYRLPDGNIAFLRRKDRQIMILGKRVEPEEVENVLNDRPAWSAALSEPSMMSRAFPI